MGISRYSFKICRSMKIKHNLWASFVGCRSTLGYVVLILCVLATIFGILEFTSLGRPVFIGDHNDRIAQCKDEISSLNKTLEYYRETNGKYPDDFRKMSPEYFSVWQENENGETEPLDLIEHLDWHKIKYLYISDEEYILTCNQHPKCEIRYSSSDKELQEIGACNLKKTGGQKT